MTKSTGRLGCNELCLSKPTKRAKSLAFGFCFPGFMLVYEWFLIVRVLAEQQGGLMQKISKILLATIGILVLAVAAEAADPVVGSIKTTEGEVFVIRSEGSMAAHAGLKLHEGDTLRTGPSGRIGVIFRDDTLLSLGSDSEMIIDEFVFSPGDNQMSMVLRLLRGMASYVSGKMAELAPEAVKIKTPVAMVGVRGTRFLIRIEG